MRLVYFTAPWCIPCKQLGPIMAEVGQTVDVEKIDVDETPELATEYGVMSIPTVVVVRDNKEVGRFSGGRDRQFVERFINSF